MGAFEDELGKTPDQPPAGGAFEAALSAPEEAQKQHYGALQTALMHGVHGASMGFSDEMRGLSRAGGNEWGVPTPTNMLKGAAKIGYGALTGDHEALDKYHQARDEYRQELEQSGKEHPTLSTLSDIGGSLATPTGELGAASWLARAGRGALSGAAQGAVRGVGDAPEISDIPKEAGVGAVVGGVLGGGLNSALGARGGVSAAKQELIDAAEKYGVQLPRYITSENPLVNFTGGTLGQLPFVGDKLGASLSKATEGVKGIGDKEIENAFGHAVTPTEARDIASKAATSARDQFKINSRKVSEKNYNDVIDAMNNPNAKFAPSNLINEVNKQSNRIGGYGGAAEGVLQKAYDATRKKGGLTYENLKDLRTDLYRQYTTKEGRGGIEYSDYNQITHAIKADMENALQQAGGPQAAALWHSANLQHRAGKDIAAELGTAIGKSTSDTSAADAVFRNINSVKPNIGAVNQLRNTMHPDEWAKVQAGTLARMGRDDSGNFSIAKFMTADSKLSDAGKNAMFGFPGSAKRDGYEAIKTIGDALNKVKGYKFGFNPSGTAIMGAGLAELYELYSDPVQGAKNLAGGALLGTILARPTTARNAGAFAKALHKYVANPAMVAAGKVPKALEIAGRNLAISMTTHDKKRQE